MSPDYSSQYRYCISSSFSAIFTMDNQVFWPNEAINGPILVPKYLAPYPTFHFSHTAGSTIKYDPGGVCVAWRVLCRWPSPRPTTYVGNILHSYLLHVAI